MHAVFAPLPPVTVSVVLPVLATWVICSENRHYENGIPSLNPLQTQSGEGKIGSRQSILMNERLSSQVKEKRML
jgi:hypothetical protein